MALTDPDRAQQQFVSVYQFRDLTEALVIKGMLESSGIDCFLGDENTVRMDWFWSNAIGGVKLWVKQSDAEAARSLIQSTDEKTQVPKNEIPKSSVRQKYALRFAITGLVISILVLISSQYLYTQTKMKVPDVLAAIFSMLCPASLAEMTMESGHYIPMGTNWFSVCLGNAMLYGLVGFAIGNAIQRRQRP